MTKPLFLTRQELADLTEDVYAKNLVISELAKAKRYKFDTIRRYFTYSEITCLGWEIYNNSWSYQTTRFSIATQDGRILAVNKERFINYVSENFPEDFEWLLWHPEVFNGEYHD